MCNTTKKNYSVQDKYTTTRLILLNTTLPIAPVELHKTKQLPPVGKEYVCFHINSKFPHASQCVKSRMQNKAIDSILYIYTLGKKTIVIKCMFQSSRLEDYMKTIGINLSLFTKSYFEHRLLPTLMALRFFLIHNTTFFCFWFNI